MTGATTVQSQNNTQSTPTSKKAATNIATNSFLRSVQTYQSQPTSPIKPSQALEYNGPVRTRQQTLKQFRNSGYTQAPVDMTSLSKEGKRKKRTRTTQLSSIEAKAKKRAAQLKQSPHSPYETIISSITPDLTEQFPMFDQLKHALTGEQTLLQNHQSNRTLEDIVQTWLNKPTGSTDKRTNASAFVTRRITLSKHCEEKLPAEEREIPLSVAQAIKKVLFDTPLDEHSSDGLLQHHINELSRKILDPQAQHKAVLLGNLANDIKQADSHDRTLELIRDWRRKETPDKKTYVQHIERHRNSLFSFFTGRTRSASLVDLLWAQAAQVENEEKAQLQAKDPVAVALHAIRAYIRTHQDDQSAAAKVVALQDLITDILSHEKKTALPGKDLHGILQKWRNEKPVLGKGQNNHQLMSRQSYISSIFSNTTECSRLITTLEKAAAARLQAHNQEQRTKETSFKSVPLTLEERQAQVQTHRPGVTDTAIKQWEAQENTDRPNLWHTFHL